MATYNPEGAKVYEKGEGYKTGRIKGKWEDAMRSAAPDDNERGWNQAAQMAVSDGHINTQAEVEQAAAWLKSNRDDNASPAIQQEPVTEPAAKTEIVNSPQYQTALNRAKEWENHSWSGNRAEETFNPSEGKYDARNNNLPNSDAVLNAYKEDFANNFSPDEASLTNAFDHTALNQQEGDVPDMPSQPLQQEEEDEFLQRARGQNLLNA